jgi:hypothetical protein
MKFDPEILNTINKLSSLESLFDLSSIWKGIAQSSMINSLCIFSAVLMFGMLVLAILARFFRRGLEFSSTDNIALIFKGILLGTFFCIPGVYTTWVSLIAGLSGKMNSTVGADALFNFQVKLRGFIYGLQASGTGAQSIANAPILDFSVSILNNLVLVTYFGLISIGPTFLVFAFAFGPICAALSLLFPGIMNVWARFIIGSMFFSLFVSVALFAFSMSSLFGLASEFTFLGNNIVAFTLLITLLFYFLMIPVALAAIYQVSIFSYVALMFSFPLLLLGQIPSLLKVGASIVTVNNNIKRFSRMIGRK